MSKEGHESRFNIKRIAYTLKATVLPHTATDGSLGHFMRFRGQDKTSPSSLVGWTDNTITARADIPGQAKLTTQEGTTVFTGENGASLTTFQDGSFIYAASASSPVSRRERLRVEQASRPWWEKDREAIENEYIYEAGALAGSPISGESRNKGTPYKHFKLKVPVSETETREFDVYAYGQAISLVNRRNIHKDDVVRLRASVQFHERRLPHGRSVLVPWLNLFDVQKMK